MKPGRTVWPWLAAAVLAAAGVLLAPLPARATRPGASLVVRLLGPVAALAADVEWVRADLAFRRGRIELFHARARVALALAPDSVDGWNYLARHQGWTLASPEREPDPEARLAWLRAGLATAAEGERSVARPGELAITAGNLLVSAALAEPELPWPGGSVALWERAAAEFQRAGELGYDAEWSAKLAASALEAAEAARRGG